MKVIETWQIHEWDGGGRHLPTDKFLATEDLADEYSLRHKNNCVVPRVLIIVDDLDELKQVEYAEVRKRALAKLTMLEKQVLGLKD